MMGRKDHSVGEFIMGAVVGGIIGASSILLLGTKQGQKIQLELIDKYGELKKDAISKAKPYIRKAKSEVKPIARKVKAKAKPLIKEAKSVAKKIVRKKTKTRRKRR